MKIAIDWNPSSVTGWGNYAINLALQWSMDPEIELWMPDGTGVMDPLRASAVCKTVLWKPSEADIWLHCLGNQFQMPCTTPQDRTIGVIFFEEPLNAEAIERAKRYPLIITGSTYNERVLRDRGLSNVRTIFQGVDRSLFHPGPSLGLFRDRFAIFSGGKAEYRKGQDIVLAAFKRFVATHPEAVLVTAWHSPWSQLPKTLDKSGLCEPVPTPFNAVEWAKRNFIKSKNVIDLGQVHNPLMPQVYRECDCAIFPNRVEGGTNLVAMEAMACGLPVALSQDTGHLDLKPQRWIDPDDPVEATYDAMEFFYSSHVKVNKLRGFEWSDAAAQLKVACKEVLASVRAAA